MVTGLLDSLEVFEPCFSLQYMLPSYSELKLQVACIYFLHLTGNPFIRTQSLGLDTEFASLVTSSVSLIS